MNIIIFWYSDKVKIFKIFQILFEYYLIWFCKYMHIGAYFCGLKILLLEAKTWYCLWISKVY